ncbi:PAS domain S-box protein [Methylobacterium sp. NEAU K]|uniref:PAS domain S-box protein n=1 Tax=Methylobacterium sp. NEAU K TaxID=3064946 RepID=UPI0027358EED|nr:PAS domain S-box protein [Methylobacterium sp. NEAU K]MDP4005532.1 PAS domain S-box protein [Methylobacterium sp. NEAU K]
MHDALDPCRHAAPSDSATPDPPPEAGFGDIVRMARRACGAAVALLGLADGDRLRLEARAGLVPGPLPPETTLERIFEHSQGCIPVGPGLLVIPDLAQDALTRDGRPPAAAPSPRFCAGAPLETRAGERLGILWVIDHAPRPGGLGAEEAEDLSALARLAVDRLELRRTRAERDRTLAQRGVVASVLAALAEAGGDLQAILDLLVAAAMDAVPEAEGGGIEMREGAELVYRSGAGTLARHVGLRLPLAGSLSGAALTGGIAILSPDVWADPRVAHDLLPVLGMRSALYVPVRRGGEAVGILKLQSARVDAFTRDDLEIAQLIAGTVASGLAEAGEAEARRATRRSEDRYQAVFEGALDHAIAVMDRDGRITDWNAAAVRILGWSPDEIRGEPAAVLFTPEDRAADVPAQAMRLALETGRSSDERWHLRRDGTRVFASGEMLALRDDDGVATGFLTILRDRTEQRAALSRLEASERALAVERAFLAAILRQAPVGIVIAYADGGSLVNLRAEAMLGHGAGERAGEEARAAGIGPVDPDGRPYGAADDPTQRALRRGETVRDARMLYRREPEGEPRRWEVSSTPIPGPDGRPAAAVTVLVDVEEELCALDAARTSQARLATVMDAVPVGILLAEAPSGRIVMGNRRIRDVLGHDTLYAAVSADYGAYVAFHADDRPVAPEDYPLARICAGDVDRAELEVRYQRPGGSRRWIAITGEAIKDAAGATIGAVVAISDIEARKRTEANQDLLNRELSHRLKNTLALVQAIAAQTLRNAPDIDAARESLAARLIALGQAHDILLAGHAEAASVAAVVNGTLALHQDGPGRIGLDGPDLLIGPSAALSLALMLHELATNAAKYGALSTQTGRVAVTWGVAPGPAGQETFTLAWRESGGPPVTRPTRKGFGSRLIERGLAGAVGGRAVLNYARSGLVCTLTAPLAGFRAES